MADFCKQCCEYYFGKDIKNDFYGIQPKAFTKKGLYTVVLCEGCGIIQVNHTGKCMSPDCIKHSKSFK